MYTFSKMNVFYSLCLVWNLDLLEEGPIKLSGTEIIVQCYKLNIGIGKVWKEKRPMEHEHSDKIKNWGTSSIEHK